MKTLLWMSITAVALSAVSGATSFNCNPYPVSYNNGGGPAGQTVAVNCAGFVPDPGFNLTSVTLTYSADYQFATVVPTDVQFTFTPNGPGGVVFTPPASIIDVAGGFSSGPFMTANAIAGTFTNSSFASGFNVSVESKVLTGAVTTSAAGVMLSWTEAPTVPEPATLGMLGIGLLGIGFLSRRKSSKA